MQFTNFAPTCVWTEYRYVKKFFSLLTTSVFSMTLSVLR